MTKRKSKTTEFKPPKRTQPRAKRQRSSEETNLLSADETQIQTPNYENNNFQNASCSEKLDEHQPGQITLQISQTTEFPVDPCSLEEKTCNDDNDEDGNGTNPPEIEQTAETAEPNNSDKYMLSQPLNVEVTKEDQPDVKLDEEKSEITSNSNHESQKVPDDCDSELPSDECQTETELSHEDTGSLATEPKMGERLGSSDIIDENSVDETGIQMTEDADPLIKRKTRKRMGMCRLGDRKKMLKEQPTSGNVFGEGLENEEGHDNNKESVMISDDSKKDGSISLEEVSGSSFPTSCPLEDILEKQEEPDVQNGNEVQVQILVECMSNEQEITHETDNTIPSHANTDNPLEDIETECVERSNNESNIREDNKPEMCDDVTTEIGTEVTVDLAEVCKESTDVSAQDAVVMEGPVEVLNQTNEESASTEIANHFEELVAGGNEMEVEECCPSELDMNTSISGHTNEQFAVNEPVSALPVIDEIKDESESLDCTLVAASVTAENTEICEETCMWSLSSPAAPPCGEDKDVQSVSEHDGLPSETHELHPSPAEPDPSSPISIHSVTDSQLNNISLEDFPIVEDTCDLEDATDLVCGLIRDLTSLNRIVRDAHRNIGLLQQGRKPTRPPFRSIYGPQH